MGSSVQENCQRIWTLPARDITHGNQEKAQRLSKCVKCKKQGEENKKKRNRAN